MSHGKVGALHSLCIITSRTIHYPLSRAATVAVTQDDKPVEGWGGVGGKCWGAGTLSLRSKKIDRIMIEKYKEYEWGGF